VTTNVIRFDNNNPTGEREKMKPATLDRKTKLDPLQSGMLKF
jgi:hypothetical protein